LVVVLLALAASMPSFARAAEHGRSIWLEYHASASCPDRLAFFELVRSRAGPVELADAERDARHFIVSLEKDEGDALYRGRLRKGRGEEIARTLEGATCEEVARGLALVIAIELGPTGAESSKPPVPASPPRPTPPPPPPVSAPSRRAERLELAGLALASIGWTSAIGAQAAPTFQAGFELRAVAGPWYLRPSLRVAASIARAPEIRNREGVLNASLLSALVRACPIAVPGLGARVSIEPCGMVEVGRLFSEGRTPMAELDTPSPWIAAGATVHVLGWATRAVFLDADLSVFAPLERYRSFLTKPEMPLFETPRVGFRWSLGGGVRFP